MVNGVALTGDNPRYSKKRRRRRNHTMPIAFVCQCGKRLSSKDETAGRRVRCRSEEHTSELQSRQYLVCRLLLEKKKKLYWSIPPVDSERLTQHGCEAAGQPPL